MSMRLYVGCALACASAGLSAEPAPSWVQAAQQALHDQLQATYPDVVSWTLTPMLSDRQAAAAEAIADVRVEPVRLGKRSALQVSWLEGERRVRQALWFAVTGEQPALLMGVDVRRNSSPSNWCDRTNARRGNRPAKSCRSRPRCKECERAKHCGPAMHFAPTM